MARSPGRADLLRCEKMVIRIVRSPQLPAESWKRRNASCPSCPQNAEIGSTGQTGRKQTGQKAKNLLHSCVFELMSSKIKNLRNLG